jgi:hypothetical protein
LDHVFKDMTTIREAQIWQPTRESIVVRIVRGTGYLEQRDERRLLHELRLRLGEEIGIQIQYCEHLAKTPAGKLRFVVSGIAHDLQQPERKITLVS